jgi:ankyrin repeat protein
MARRRCDGYETILQLLLANPKVDSDPKNKDGRTLLWWAACMGHEAIVQLLLASPKVDPNFKDDDGRTPLWQAIWMGRQAIVQLLLANPRSTPTLRTRKTGRRCGGPPITGTRLSFSRLRGPYNVVATVSL